MKVALRIETVDPKKEHPGAFYDSSEILTRKDFSSLPKEALDDIFNSPHSHLGVKFDHANSKIIVSPRWINPVVVEHFSYLRSDDSFVVQHGTPLRVRFGTEEFKMSVFRF